MRTRLLLACLGVLCFGASPAAHAQVAKRVRKTPVAGARNGLEDAPRRVDTALYGMLEYRDIGPTRGGRASAIAGVPSEPNLFYMGSDDGLVDASPDGGAKLDRRHPAGDARADDD